VVKIFIVFHVLIFMFRSAHSSGSDLSSTRTQFASLWSPVTLIYL